MHLLALVWWPLESLPPHPPATDAPPRQRTKRMRSRLPFLRSKFPLFSTDECAGHPAPQISIRSLDLGMPCLLSRILESLSISRSIASPACSLDGDKRKKQPPPPSAPQSHTAPDTQTHQHPTRSKRGDSPSLCDRGRGLDRWGPSTEDGGRETHTSTSSS